MLFQPCGNGKYVKVKDDVLRIVPNHFGQYFISPFAYFNLPLQCIGLANFVKGHHYHGSTVTLTNKGLLNKFLFSFLHGDGVNDTPALHAF